MFTICNTIVLVLDVKRVLQKNAYGTLASNEGYNIGPSPESAFSFNTVQISRNTREKNLEGRFMPISIDRSICCDLNETISREWLITNNLGGYAAGTVAGVLTRREQGLLVAMSPGANTPHLLLAKIDEEVSFDQRTYYLGTNEYRDGTFNPAGFLHLESFRLEEGFPVFTYRIGGLEGIFLEKRIWMIAGQNTTCVQYRAIHTHTLDNFKDKSHRNSALKLMPSTMAASALPEDPYALTLTLLPLATYRPHSKLYDASDQQSYSILSHSQATLHIAMDGLAGCTLQADQQPLPCHILAIGDPESQITFLPTGVWYHNFVHRFDEQATIAETEDFYLPGVFRATLWPDQDATLTIVISSEELASLPLQVRHLSYLYEEIVKQKRTFVASIVDRLAHTTNAQSRNLPLYVHKADALAETEKEIGKQDFYRCLLYATQQFSTGPLYTPDAYQFSTGNKITGYNTLKRPFTGHHHENQTGFFTHYYGMIQSVREMLIALPGILLATQRYQIARSLLQTLSHYFIGCILPDRLPSVGQPLNDQDYGSADTALWYFYALDHYLNATDDMDLLGEVFPALKECVNRYLQGTYNGIGVDSADGLLVAYKKGNALTWMNARVDDKPVTPRSGKPVEINALWYHALALMVEWSRQLQQTGNYQRHLEQCRQTFLQRFWHEDGGYLYDVIDGPEGADDSLRPNQLLALSLRHAVIKGDNHKSHSIMNVVTQHLFTPYGLRTLAPYDRQYRSSTMTANRQGDNHQDPHKANALVLHQGSIWPWLIGPYIDASLATFSQPDSSNRPVHYHEYLWRRGINLLEPFYDRFKTGLLGSIEGVLEDNGPYIVPQTSQMISSAISVGELLRSYHKLMQLRINEKEQVLSHP